MHFGAILVSRESRAKFPKNSRDKAGRPSPDDEGFQGLDPGRAHGIPVCPPGKLDQSPMIHLLSMCH